MAKSKFNQEQENTIQEIIDALEDDAAKVYAEIKRIKPLNIFKRIPNVLDLTKALVARAEMVKSQIADATGQLVKEAIMRMARQYGVPSMVVALLSGLIDMAVDELNNLIGRVWPDPQAMAGFYFARVAKRK